MEEKNLSSNFENDSHPFLASSVSAIINESLNNIKENNNKTENNETKSNYLKKKSGNKFNENEMNTSLNILTDPLGVCQKKKNEEEEEEENGQEEEEDNDYNYYFSQISPSSSKSNFTFSNSSPGKLNFHHHGDKERDKREREEDVPDDDEEGFFSKDFNNSLSFLSGEYFLNNNKNNNNNKYKATTKNKKEEEDEEEEDKSDLLVAIDNPEKHSSHLDTFISFRVTTKTSKAEYKKYSVTYNQSNQSPVTMTTNQSNQSPVNMTTNQSNQSPVSMTTNQTIKEEIDEEKKEEKNEKEKETLKETKKKEEEIKERGGGGRGGEMECHVVEVRRRYRDFLWLRSQLLNAHPFLLIPPLPGKHVMKLNHEKFSDPFLTIRSQSLNNFISRLSSHPVLSNSEFLYFFLTLPHSELQAMKNNNENKSLLNRIAQHLPHVTMATHNKRSEEFEKEWREMEETGERMKKVERVGEKIVKQQIEIVQSLKEWSPLMTLWSNSEETLKFPLVTMATSIHKQSIALQNLINKTENNFLPQIRDYILYVESNKSVLKKRDNFECVFFELKENLIKKYKNNENKDEIEKLEKEIEIKKKELEKANILIKTDLNRWKKIKKKEIKNILFEFSKNHALYHELGLMSWQNNIPVMKNTINNIIHN